MSTKVNIVLDDDVRAELTELVPSGARSRVINDALRRELLRLRRTAALRDLDRLRTTTKRASTGAIVSDLRRLRNSR
jgi:Arc/MetJ family transcription regulator